MVYCSDVLEPSTIFPLLTFDSTPELSTGVADTGVADTGVADTGVAGTGAAGTGAAGTGRSTDGFCLELSQVLWKADAYRKGSAPALMNVIL